MSELRQERPARLGREARREQLLATARELISSRGVGALTMENLAAAAGVNKAIPYRHFDNAHSVVAELFDGFNREIAERVLVAAREDGTVEERVRRVVRAYLDCVRENADILAVLSVPGSSVRTSVEGDNRIGARFAADLFRDLFKVPERDAWAMASLVQGALAGGVDTLVNREASRRRVEEALVVAITALVTAYAR